MNINVSMSNAKALSNIGTQAKSLSSNNILLGKKTEKVESSTGKISSEAVVFTQPEYKLNVSNETLKSFSNDFAEFNSRLEENQGSEADQKLLEDFLVKFDEYKEQGVFDADNENGSNKLLQDTTLKFVEDFSIKAMNEELSNNLKEMHEYSAFALNLARGLGKNTGRLDISKDGVSKMLEEYKGKLGKDEIDKSYSNIHSLEDITKYSGKIEFYRNESETYASILEKLNEMKTVIKNSQSGMI